MAIDRVRKMLRRGERGNRDASIFLVATEGEHTERIYLSAFDSPRIKIIPLHCEDGKSSPAGVLDRIREAMQAFDFGDGDSFWMLVDRDSWTEKMFSEVQSDCKKMGIVLATSNERFEVFLCAHFQDFYNSEQCLKGEYEKFLVARLGGFRKNGYDSSNLVKRAALACESCRSRDDGGHELWPSAPGSRAYLLVEAILERM